jgi:hypothetical protein
VAGVFEHLFYGQELVSAKEPGVQEVRGKLDGDFPDIGRSATALLPNVLQAVTGNKGELKVSYFLYAVPNNALYSPAVFYEIEFKDIMAMNGVLELSFMAFHNIKAVTVCDWSYFPEYV